LLGGSLDGPPDGPLGGSLGGLLDARRVDRQSGLLDDSLGSPPGRLLGFVRRLAVQPSTALLGGSLVDKLGGSPGSSLEGPHKRLARRLARRLA